MNRKTQQIQHLIGTHEGAADVAKEALDALVHHLGTKALPVLESIEANLTEKHKNSGIPAEHEMRHAEVVKPVLDEITRLITDARNSLQ